MAYTYFLPYTCCYYVTAGIFLVAQLLPLFIVLPAIMNGIAFIGSGSIIHSMKAVVGYSPARSQNMALMGI
ncbi:NAD(P)H-quinone oxidoreductase subunit 5 [Spatholobus suberectus]|nr:NAD(P)H-quinone oxidoreductase subunit 5 [Spatholobus suberectus]